MSRAPAISHSAMRRAGWERIDPRPWRKCAARWARPDGWRLEHCGHPTALWPLALYAPDGLMHVAFNGRAWPSLSDAVAYVRDGATSEPGGAPDRRRASHPYVHGVRSVGAA